METSVLTGWTDFLVASAGVLAALAGLVFISLSINLAKILEMPGLPGRAAETIIVLAGGLAGCLVCLIPHLSARSLAVTLGLVTGLTWFGPVLIQVRTVQTHRYFRVWIEILRAIMHQIATLPGVMAAFALGGVIPGGMLWFGAGIVLSVLSAILNAWVLLVEIMR